MGQKWGEDVDRSEVSVKQKWSEEGDGNRARGDGNGVRGDRNGARKGMEMEQGVGRKWGERGMEIGRGWGRKWGERG